MKPTHKKQSQLKQQPKQAKQSDSAGPQKVFDVRRPGRAPASATSRPVITSHKPPIKDPDVSLASGAKKRELMNPKEKVTVQPPEPSPEDTKEPAAQPSHMPASDNTASGSGAAALQKSKTTATETPGAPELPDALQQAKPPKPETPSQAPAEPAAEAPDVGGTAVDGALAPAKEKPRQISPTPIQTSQQNQPKQSSEPLHMDMPGELAAGKVVVSHHRGRRTLWLELLLILLILLLLAAIFNFLLDAEVIKTDLNLPHTDFFDS